MIIQIRVEVEGGEQMPKKKAKQGKPKSKAQPLVSGGKKKKKKGK